MCLWSYVVRHIIVYVYCIMIFFIGFFLYEEFLCV
nr:MAG TPA: hypothetical protein [Caudoviricetes sp.]